MALQHLRSNTASKRPTAGAMSDGQIAVNTNATSPGLFFKDAGGAIIKVGPVHVGTTAPNSSPAGSTGNSLGEQWLDTSGGGYVLKIWDGSAWRSEVGEFVDAAGDTMTGALILPNGTAAAPALGVGSTDNGLYSPGTDQVAISTNGTGRLIVRSNGDIEIPSTTQKFVNSNGVGAFSIGGGFPEFPLSVTGLNVLPRTTSLRALSIGSLSGQTGDLFNASSSSGVPLVRIEADGTISLRGGDYIRTTQAEDLRFGTNNTERLRITSTGLVGIGTSSPSNTLHVVGAGRFNVSGANNAVIASDGGDPFIYTEQAAGLKFGTNSAVRMTINSSGSVGIGTTSPSSPIDTGKLMVQGGDIVVRDDQSSNAWRRGRLVFDIRNSNGDSKAAHITGGRGSDISSNIQFYTTVSHSLAERMRIDDSGRLLVGTSSNRTNLNLQLEGTTGAAAGASFIRNETGNSGGTITLGKSGGTSNGSFALVANNDTLGSIIFSGADGSASKSAAYIQAFVDGTPGADDMPGRLVFSVTRDGSASPTEALRISNSGQITHATEQNVNQFIVDNTNASLSSSLISSYSLRAANASYAFFYATSSNGTDVEFNLRGDGNGFCDGSWTGGGADYAEYFEWSDSNPNDEDRRGISVVLDGDKIREAIAGEDPIGVISGNPSVVGDAAWNKWTGKYLRDDFGTYIQEDYEVEDDDDGNIVVQQRRKLNPDYNPDIEYVSRKDRPEWDCVGLMGKLRIRKGQITGSRWIKMRDVSDSVEEWLVR